MDRIHDRFGPGNRGTGINMTETEEARNQGKPSTAAGTRVNDQYGTAILKTITHGMGLCSTCMKARERDHFGDLVFCGEMVSSRKEGTTVYNCPYYVRVCSGCEFESDCTYAGKEEAFSTCGILRRALV